LLSQTIIISCLPDAVILSVFKEVEQDGKLF
ncbi:MAG: hypothetical protein CFH07_00245, partial [Alphaproteobacteria bacterium MarineAlpha3_Bin6]